MAAKKFMYAMLLVVMALFAVASVAALPVTIDQVKVNGDELESGSTNYMALQKDNEFEIKVRVTATDDVDNAQIEVAMRGYDHDDLIEDISDVFDMKANRTYIKKFKIKLPWRMDKDTYKLRVRVEDRDGSTTQENYEIDVESDRHEIKIKDVIFSPSNYVVAGRSLLTVVRLENIGMVDEEGVKVKISIPALGISAADYLDEVEEDDSETSEELYLRIPPCVDGGNYEATISLVYDDGDEITSVKKTVRVVEDETCIKPEQETTPKTIITVGPTTQDVTIGQGGVVYPMTLSNAGKQAKTYIVTADGYNNWADISISPANIVVLQPGEAKALYVYVTAKSDAQPGEHMFVLKVSSGSETLKQFTLKSNVVAAKEQKTTNWDKLKKGLLIGVVVLVVLLVILALVIGFSKLKSEDDFEEDEEDAKGQTYY